MERPIFYNRIETNFNPNGRLQWNQPALARIAEIVKPVNHITITGMEYAYFHPDKEITALSASERHTSDAILKQVFPDCPPPLPLPPAATYYDPFTGLSTITLNHEAIETKADIVDPNNADKAYIELINDLTRRCLWQVIQAEKWQAIGDILSIPLGELETLAGNIVYDALCLPFFYGGYHLSKWKDYFCYVGAGAELLDNLAASWAVTRELCLNRPCLVNWK